ncbi:hypothetical protein QWI17_07320 [Gilvimarinus sp. SDUM040013]|uniref:Uncharacterized protein n=1 Tax=Gilvimarinus gilvus TaxID=3058038 RepID=A0ABU4S2J5_9GAMM|nr:hypothetical protein [Gilvimarinus sp. SDUM040013]MDO3385643.1 hypothetical protein [Gilvimarinus sp. SDUM040013]MDX6851395.1 hypothetical protein [Gilvimarinus sp. SDUM040013]
MKKWLIVVFLFVLIVAGLFLKNIETKKSLSYFYNVQISNELAIILARQRSQEEGQLRQYLVCLLYTYDRVVERYEAELDERIERVPSEKMFNSLGVSEEDLFKCEEEYM